MGCGWPPYSKGSQYQVLCGGSTRSTVPQGGGGAFGVLPAFGGSDHQISDLGRKVSSMGEQAALGRVA